MRSDVLVSVILPVHNGSEWIESRLNDISAMLCDRYADYEIVVVDNASEDDTTSAVEHTAEYLPNIQLFALAHPVRLNTLLHVGLENCIGDVAVTVEDRDVSVQAIPAMVAKAQEGYDIVYSVITGNERNPDAYVRLSEVFFRFYNAWFGARVTAGQPALRLLSRRVVNFVLDYGNSYELWKTLPSLSGYSRCEVVLSGPRQHNRKRSLSSGFSKALDLLLSTSAAPMRLVTLFSLTIAAVDLLYAVYVIVMRTVTPNVGAGWTSISLEVAMMFFLFSIVLALMSEYIVRLFDLVLERPRYQIRREFTSPVLTRTAKLNIHAAGSKWER